MVTDDKEWGSDIEDMGPGDVPEPGPDEPELVSADTTGQPEGESGKAGQPEVESGRAEPPQAESPAPTPEGPEGEAAEEPEERHSLKQTARETVAKAVGIAVELGSVLGGQGGEIVGAERDVAEAETEELIDRVDGEDE